ncbi:MAG TPA: formyl-CoA transferase [Acidobacteria bacterium]|nr:formyl-CoA transferase [Acidobacteriota bacterium]|tara:strand:- start:4787 stop:6007 length:1221 start_codon:yes stop_codon:yes gene_type:complete
MGSSPKSRTPSPGPLDGLTVLDLTRVLSGPYCTMMLADMGARVIKIEHPERGDDTRGWGPPFVSGESTYFLSVNRNKESVTLDFKTPEGREVLDALIERADVLVENFRPGTLDRLGLGYTDVRSRNPQLVYVSISGFGQTGPRRQEPGYDAAIQAEGGLMSITGDANGPGYRLGVAIADITAGMFAAYGTSLALFARQRSNQGQLVDIGMLDSVAALLTYQAGIHFATGGIPERLGNRHPTVVPYETFEATDGEFVLAVGNDALWRKFCIVAGLEEIVADPRFATNRARVQAYDELRPLLERALRTRSRQTWIEDLTAAGVPCGDVRNIAQVLADPQLAAREMVTELEHIVAGKIRVLGIPTKLSETPGTVKNPPPALGEHTDKVLEELLDINQAERSRLRQLGAI